MIDDLIPHDIREFILAHIDSVAQLEALLLLRSNPDTEWSTAEVAARLYITEAVADDVLIRLFKSDLCIRADRCYRYNSSDTGQSIMVDRLAEAYARYLIPITNIVHEKPLHILKFADAFRLRKD